MAGLPATAKGDKAELKGLKIIRNKSYTYLKELVDDVREAGKHDFGYTVTYRKGSPLRTSI